MVNGYVQPNLIGDFSDASKHEAIFYMSKRSMYVLIYVMVVNVEPTGCTSELAKVEPSKNR